MFSHSKAKIRKKIKESSPYLPYPISNGLNRLLNRGYLNWLNYYTFEAKEETIKKLQNKQVLFIHIPKCGGNSINQGLLKVEPGMGHLTAFDYLMAFGYEKYKSFFKFTFVRNPWDRLVSSYFFMKEGGWKGQNQSWFRKNIGNFLDFDQFVKHWVTSKNIRRHIVFTPQIEFVTINNTVELDFIGRCEQMEKDIEYIAKQIAVDFEYRIDNKSEHPDYRELYTAKSKDIVFNVYKKDIENFGYEF